ncbi:MAG: preprotein translocase subunit SecA, partial [Planctomycetota bacterium]
ELTRDEHYEVKEKEKAASLLEDGILKAQELADVESFYQPGFEDWPHYIENALRAKELYTNDKEYVVEESEVIIVDEFTGRKMNGRRWSDGLHQAVEVKEGLEPKSETQTLATITFQNYFRMFEKLAGMTGTALTEAGEFHKIYELDVVSIPTNLPIARDDGNDVVYRTEPEKWRAITREIARVNEKGQPALVGTASVENSEKVSQYLKLCWCESIEGEHKRGIKGCENPEIFHEILNAKNHTREASIIAMAGAHKAVTIATNMAGRGTDIKLGGNFEYRLSEALEAAELKQGDTEHLVEIDRVREEMRVQCQADESVVQGLGGLYVLGTERHEARRIDNQLRGRSGRQGNSGESRFFLSLQDPLMRIFYRDWVTNAMEKMGMTEDQEIESGMVTRAIGRAQKKVEERNFEIRKSLLEYDGVMDEQRKMIYSVRQEVLEGVGHTERISDMLSASLQRAALTHVEDSEGLKEWCLTKFGFEVEEQKALDQATLKEEPDFQPLTEIVLKRFEERQEDFGKELSDRVASYLLLNSIDSKWKDHLHAVDALKAGIGLRGYGQVDPKTEYKREGMDMFHKQLIPAIEDEVASLVLRIQVQRPPEPGAVAEQAQPGQGGGLAPRGMVQGATDASGAGTQPRPSAAQIQAYKRQVQTAQARQAMQPRVAASNAFDLMKRQQAVAQQKSAPEDEAAEAQKAKEAENAQAAAAKAAEGEQYAGAARNEACPCGSGKKFKKCHGKN